MDGRKVGTFFTDVQPSGNPPEVQAALGNEFNLSVRLWYTISHTIDVLYKEDGFYLMRFVSVRWNDSQSFGSHTKPIDRLCYE